MTSQQRNNRKKWISPLARREERSSYLFLAPAIVLLILFVFIPMINAARISMHSWDLLTDMKWVGFDNFKTLLQDKDWWAAIGRTFLYVACYVPALYVMALLLALLVKHIPKGSGLFRTAYFMPVILSSVVTGIVWKLMYNERSGVVNNVFETLIGQRIPWLSSMEWSMPAVLIVHVWMQMGYYMIIFLAGLQDIPKSYYEAAQIDGASPWQTFWKITLPNLSNTSLFVIVMSVIASFQAYDQIAMLTQGGPASSTTLAVQYIYDTAFGLYDMGYAASLAINLFVIILAFTLLQFKLMKVRKD